MCEHKNKKLIDWTFSYGSHTSTHECLDCGDVIKSIDVPKIYDYCNGKLYTYKGVFLHKKDIEIIEAKEKCIQDGVQWTDSI